jgi:hypothetical protein
VVVVASRQNAAQISPEWPGVLQVPPQLVPPVCAVISKLIVRPSDEFCSTGRRVKTKRQRALSEGPYRQFLPIKWA